MGIPTNETFLRLFGGRVVTNVGDSLYYVAAMWLVYDITGSTALTGLIGFLTGLPRSVRFLFGPIADRYELRWLFVATQVVQGVGVAVIPIAAATGWFSVWLLVAVAPVLSLLNQLVYPATSAAVPFVVDEDDLVTANSLLAATGQGTDAVFNAVGGVLIGVVGAMALFTADVVTFGIAVVLFAGVTVDRPQQTTETGYVDEIRHGIEYLRGTTIIKIYATSMVANLGAGAVFAVLPAFADALGGAATYGYLLSAVAAGTLVGALGASVVDGYPCSTLRIVGSGVSSLAFAGVVLVPSVPATLTLAFLGTVPIGANNVLVASLVQSTVDDQLLGRVLSIVQSLTTATLPLGNLLGGVLGDAVSAGGVILLLAGFQAMLLLVYVFDADLRSIPSVADADPADLRLPTD